ncbi:MAG: hypothetical protein HOW97_11635 [Catenulispora sp.]|nr:hypothetical protein [Catenulispora sp.]
MDDDDVRRMLRKAAMREEKEHRDLIGPAVQIVLRRRRRVRSFGAAGSGLVVAAGATAALWAAGPPTAARPEPAASSTTTVSPSTRAEPSQWDKSHDVFYRLPGLLNPLLPSGLALRKSTSTVPNTVFQLSGPAGTNDFNLSAVPKTQRNRALEYGNCVAGGVCSNRQLPNGTLYIQNKSFTADYGGKSDFAPGTGKQVLSMDAEYEFVPTASDGYTIDVTLSAAVSHEHYAAKPPKEWGNEPWPPAAQAGEAFNPSGILLTPDDFTALISKSGFQAVATVLDPSSPVDQSTLARHKEADVKIAAAAKRVLPAGITLALGTSDQQPSGADLVLTGPTGSNEFSWWTDPQQKNWRHGRACESHTRSDCTWKEVPGGEVEMTHASNIPGSGTTSTYTPGQADVPSFSGDTYTYLPDDPDGTVVTISTREQIRDLPWPTTRPSEGPYADPTMAWPPPARTGEAFNAAGPLLSVDQFVAVALTPGIADVVHAVNQAMDPLSVPTAVMFG